jgi:DNA-directed RNA polymerase sigma subunit (sigma70/sigma32)
VADRGEHTLVEVAAVLGVSKQRVEQIENSALKKLAMNAAARRLRE